MMNAGSLRGLARRALNSRWFIGLGRASAPAWALAVPLGVALAICEADLFVPLFWQRRTFIKLGFLIAAAVVQAVLFVPSVQRFLRQFPAVTRPAEIFSRGLATAAVLTSAVWIMAQAAVALSRVVSTRAGHKSLPTVDSGAELIFLFALAGLMIMIHMDPISGRLRPPQRLSFPLVFLTLCFAIIYLINNLLPLISTSQWTFAFPNIIPTLNPVGVDFRAGIYRPAERLATGAPIYSPEYGDWYPPLVAALGLPYVVLNENAAYMLHVLILFAANALCLPLAAWLARDHFGASQKQPAASTNGFLLAILLLVAFNLFSGYPFLFSIERGNSDIIAMAFALAAMGVVLRSPQRIWWQVLLLSISVHLKVYPVLLFAVLFIVNGFRVVLPAVIVNLALLLVLGPANALGFIQNLFALYPGAGSVGSGVRVWIGNHSGYSLGYLLTGASPAAAQVALEMLLTCLPLALWILGCLMLTRFASKRRAVLTGFMLTAPVMTLVPTVANDYQLVILFPAILMLLFLILLRMRARQHPSDYWQLLLVAIACLDMGRSYALMPTLSILVQNKYVWVMLLELVILGNVYQQLHEERMESARGLAPA